MGQMSLVGQFFPIPGSIEDESTSGATTTVVTCNPKKRDVIQDIIDLPL